jgi:polyribonucleotide nucleotidyltransferase
VARINGEFHVNPGREALKGADIDIIVAATLSGVMMVEGEAKQCSEKDLVDAIRYGHEAIKVQCQAQLDLAQKVGEAATVKREFSIPEPDADLKAFITEFASKKINEIAGGALEKKARRNAFDTLKKDLEAALVEKHDEEYFAEHKDESSKIFEKLKKELIRDLVLSESKRLDGRRLDEVRHIWTEVDYLPAAHGSAVFTRGETQALTSVTLGTKQDEMLVDTALDMRHENFILHYNFPAFSVGEIKPQRGPGRREVGHANLAGRSVRQLLPGESPYTIRIVSDILESNGSSSMATVCAASMALMDAGVQIPEHIAGIAMGMIAKDGKAAILSDILGDEDALGDMDFKVTGTEKGIVGCQMDIKIDGMPYEWLEKALEQARQGRLHILGKLNEGIQSARPELKPHVPRVDVVTIEKSFIGAVIGPGGKIIQEIQESTGTTISIDEVDGRGVVHIYGKDAEAVKKARARVDTITHVPEVGNVYEGRVASLMPYGVFVDFMGRSGLLHISEVSHSRIDKVEDVFSEGDTLKIKLIEIDKRTGKYRLSRKALIPRPQRPQEATQEGAE